MSISLMVSFWASSPLLFAFRVTVLFYRYLYFVVITRVYNNTNQGPKKKKKFYI